MTNLIKKTSFYEVNTTSETTMTVRGNVTIGENSVIKELYLNFLESDTTVGIVNYREYDSSFNYNYIINDESKRQEIVTITDSIILDIKIQKLSI